MLRVTASIVMAFVVGLTAARALPPDHYHYGPRDESIETIVMVGVNVKDMERSRAYYKDIIGLKVIPANVNPERTKLSFTGKQDEPVLMLIPKDNVQGNTLAKVVFKVRDMEGILKKHKAAGYKVISEPNHFYADQPHFSNTHLADPDGHDVELIQEDFK